MINESIKNVKAYWFFTIKTLPDQELLTLINNDKHEIGLHVVKHAWRELELLKRKTRKDAHYFTIHGTERLLGRIFWKREIRGKEVRIPDDFCLSNFQKLPTKGFALDRMCYEQTVDKVIEEIMQSKLSEYVLYFHPEWLFKRGKINHRGPFYEALRRILDVDKKLEDLAIRKKILFTIASDAKEYAKDVTINEKLVEDLRKREVDIFTFIERRWCYTIPNPAKDWIKVNDNIGLLQVTSYNEWWSSIGKKTRNMVRKAEKSGIRTTIVEPCETLAEGIWKIYNETPIRQERSFPHFGKSLNEVKKVVLSSQNCTFIGAFLQDELVGFIQLVHGDNIAIISQILSLQKHWDKAVNNALVAKAVEVCANKKIRWLMYGRMGNHPSLDAFKRNNGFAQFMLTRYYIPLTKKGKIATRLGLHREIKDALPTSIKYPLIPIYNWISRSKAKIRFRLKPKTIVEQDA